MATLEQVAELRNEVNALRVQFETATADEAGRREQQMEDLRSEVQGGLNELLAHLNTAQEKMDEDVGALQVELALLRENQVTRAVTGFSPQTSVVTGADGQKMHLTQRRGFDGLPIYEGGAQWEDWMFTIVDWLRQENPDFEGLLRKVEGLAEEPEEPEEGTEMSLGGVALTTSEKWCCEELYHLLSRKTKGGPNMFVRNLESLVSSRGARALYRIVREAKGQVEARATELTELLHDPHRKPVEANNLVTAVEKLEALLREFEAITGKPPDEHAKL